MRAAWKDNASERRDGARERRDILGAMVRSFDLKAEAEMRLDSDRRAEELARKRGEKPTPATDGTQGPAHADGPPAAGAADAGDGEEEGVS